MAAGLVQSQAFMTCVHIDQLACADMLVDVLLRAVTIWSSASPILSINFLILWSFGQDCAVATHSEEPCQGVCRSEVCAGLRRLQISGVGRSHRSISSASSCMHLHEVAGLLSIAAGLLLAQSSNVLGHAHTCRSGSAQSDRAGFGID